MITKIPNGQDEPRETLSNKDEILRRSREKGALKGVRIKNVNFDKEIFNDEVDFSGAIFCEGVSFFLVRFACKANFWKAQFEGMANFEGAEFKKRADFCEAEFRGKANFMKAHFIDVAFWGRVKFMSEVDFEEATFTKEEDTFTKMVDFWRAEFGGNANFRKVQFGNSTRFGGAKFNNKAIFFKGQFGDMVRFWRAKFNSEADFGLFQFTKRAYFRGAVFEGQAVFEGKNKGKKNKVFSQEAQIDFSNAYFVQPEKVFFNQVYLGETTFLNANISKINFNDVEWVKGEKRKTIYDEEKMRKIELRIARRKDENYRRVQKLYQQLDERYRLVGKLYQQLKVNFEAKGDYAGAGDFHRGEMEMRRLQRKKRFERILIWGYKYSSDYGESLEKPLLWLGIIVLVFPILYLISGMKCAACNFCFEFKYELGDLFNLSFWRNYFKVLLDNLQILTHLGNPEFYPAGWGYWVLEFQRVAGLILATLFTLALKRRFKR